DLLKRLERLLAFLVAALHVMLVSPGPALEPVAEQSAQNSGQYEPREQEKQLLSHLGPSRRPPHPRLLESSLPRRAPPAAIRMPSDRFLMSYVVLSGTE